MEKNKRRVIISGAIIITIAAISLFYFWGSPRESRKVAGDTPKNYELPPQITTYHCIAILSVVDHIGQYPVRVLYKKFEEVGDEEKVVVEKLKTLIAKAIHESLLSEFQHKIYCNIQEFRSLSDR